MQLGRRQLALQDVEASLMQMSECGRERALGLVEIGRLVVGPPWTEGEELAHWCRTFRRYAAARYADGIQPYCTASVFEAFGLRWRFGVAGGGSPPGTGREMSVSIERVRARESADVVECGFTTPLYAR
jgi:hypothetical protein